MRKPVIAGNWKMYKLVSEAVSLVLELKPLVANANHCEVVVAPPYTSLRSVADRLEGSGIKVAGQNLCESAEFGARTGEVNGAMLRDAGCEWVIIGHSERREFSSENDALVNAKLKAAMKTGLRPIVCVGERLEEREAGRAEEVVRSQVTGSLGSLTPDEAMPIVVAYEPVWAIGTGRTATPEIAQSMHASIRRFLMEQFGNKTADLMRILYGGSVKPDNIKALMAQRDIDGALVGGASLDARSFAQIVNYPG
ncbi:MAG: triose-phosphate isomerase [Acidobacteria bacterium]|nr:triose-phosphate isomerase [Acidobacteriota bacterium]